jgi:hypothetical protein
MAIRKSVEETLVIAGSRNEVFRRCESALKSQGFTKVTTNVTLYKIEGQLHKLTVWGEILITLLPAEGKNTKITMRATAGVDNVWALFSSPTKKILAAFKAGF